MRRLRRLLPAVALAAIAAGCDTDEILSVDPTTVTPSGNAIRDAVSARAAVAGMHDQLQDGSYYGESFVSFVELSSDNALHSGTFSTYATADNFQNNAENTTVAAMWEEIYEGIGRTNAVIEALSEPTFVISEDEQNQALAEAYFLRALGHHNAVKLWGSVPLITATVKEPQDAANVTRASVTEVYTQILADLDAAESHVNEEPTWTQITQGAIDALRARVLLYRGDYAGALAAAEATEDYGYDLAPNFSDLFDERGNATDEDIYKVRFNDQDAGSVSYYYMSKGLGGRREVGPSGTCSNGPPAVCSGPSASLPYGGARWAFFVEDSLAGIDATVTQAGASPRRAWTLSNNLTGSSNYIAKFRSVVGTEHIHAIRFAEVLLIKAEAQARLNDLAGATTTLNRVRARAGLPDKVLGTTGYTTQAEVIDAVIRERRLELFGEGDRWPDLIRLGLAQGLANGYCVAVVEEPCPEQALYPIPQTELDVWANPQQQNPGY